MSYRFIGRGLRGWVHVGSMFVELYARIQPIGCINAVNNCTKAKQRDDLRSSVLQFDAFGLDDFLQCVFHHGSGLRCGLVQETVQCFIFSVPAFALC